MEAKERFEVLLEHMDKNIQTVLEGHLSLDQKIEKGLEEARVDRASIKQQMSLFVQTLAEKIEEVDQKVEINREKIEKVGQKVEINREKIEKVGQKVEINRQEIVKNRTKIEAIDRKFSFLRQDYEDHEERIKILEAIK